MPKAAAALAVAGATLAATAPASVPASAGRHFAAYPACGSIAKQVEKC